MFAENVETLLERQRQQKPGEQLDAGLNHPQLLQQTVPITVQPLDFGFAAAFTLIPLLVVFRVIDIAGHGRDHRITCTGAISRAMNFGRFAK
jgi:hypothetical protein